MDQQQLFLTLAKLKSQSGGTSLITYFLQENTSLWLATQKLNEELGTASNIKDKQVRKDTEKALKFALYQLKTSKLQKVPENGLILCSGCVIEDKCCV